MSAAPAIREKHAGLAADRSSVRLWLRLLSCTLAIEKTVTRRFAEKFGTTLARFDVLAALDRTGDGLTMSELSRALLVSNGNATQLVQKLVRDGLVAIEPNPTDRRSSIVRLTERGAAHFAELARAHQRWIDDLFVGVGADQRERLYDSLGVLKHSIAGENHAA